MSDITIKNVVPKAALPGGEVVIEYAGHELVGTARPEVRFGDFNAQITMASNDHIIAKVPESSAEITVRFHHNSDRKLLTRGK